MNKITILFFSLIGEVIKLFYNCFYTFLPYGLNKNEERGEKVIVSLTSYGRRVSSTLPYALYSLLRQTYKPDKIIVWLDSTHWNEVNLPRKVQKLKKNGVDFQFCRDIKSYKKLIPTLELYPEDIIITVDDDLFYKADLIERLMKEYSKDNMQIYTHRAHRPLFDNKGILLPYNNWDDSIQNSNSSPIFPTGGAGCLYKKSLLYKDVCNDDLFMNLCPKADDVWFYFMGVLQKTRCTVLKKKGYVYIPLDVFYQYFHKDSNLSNTNCKDSYNDVQIDSVMKYYNIKTSDLMLN